MEYLEFFLCNIPKIEKMVNKDTAKLDFQMAKWYFIIVQKYLMKRGQTT